MEKDAHLTATGEALLCWRTRFANPQSERTRWLYGEDHVAVMLLAACQELVHKYYVGGHGERTSRQVVEACCLALDRLRPVGVPTSA